MHSGKANGRLRTVLVAGGAGFLGSHLCETLMASGRRVLCVDSFLTGSRETVAPLMARPMFRLIEHDICDPLEPGERIDQIYNLGCPASPPHYQADPVHTTSTCVIGTLNLLDLAERWGARFVQASTSEVYGDPEEHPQREDYVGHVNCTGPRACYDEGKRAAESLCFDFLRARRADVRVARIFNTYGPRMDPADGRIVSNLVVQSLTGRALTIYGDGMQTRSFCYVSDLVRGLVRLMEVEPNPALPVNLGNPAEFSINELAQLVSRMTGSQFRPRHFPVPPDDPRRRRPDITRAKKLLNWSPEIPIEEGLAPTIAYFRSLLGASGRKARKRVAANGKARPAPTMNGVAH